MKSKLSLLVSLAVISGSLAQSVVAHAGCCCRRAASDRGVAILSPVESPDPCDSPVGGCYRYTPYYPGYAPDRRCPVVYGTSTGWYGTYYGTGAFDNRSAGYGRGDYGAFSGASRDEASLLRLGGRGPASNGSYRPYNGGAGDLIDRIQSPR